MWETRLFHGWVETTSNVAFALCFYPVPPSALRDHSVDKKETKKNCFGKGSQNTVIVLSNWNRKGVATEFIERKKGERNREETEAITLGQNLKAARGIFFN